jgi:acyl-CoA thioester hydrolase
VSEDLLAGYPVIVRIPVQWGDMDAYGHVNNTVFFRYFESARVDYLLRCGFVDAYDNDKVGAILHSTSCRFRKPLFYPDTALVGARATELKDDRFTLEYKLVSDAHHAVAAEGSSVVVSLNYVTRDIVPIPGRVRELIEQIEA